MLTNFQTIRKQIRRLKELERGQEENAFEFYTKKERLMLDRERQKLDKYLAGVKDMGRLPGAVFIVDAKRETIAVREASRLGIPVIAITDTNADPDKITFPIPGNDDAIRSVGLISAAIANTIEETRREVPEEERRPEEAEATTYSTETGETTEKERPAARRRPRRKRRPRPEVIAQHLKGEGEEGGEGEDAEDDSDSEASEASTEEAAPKDDAKANAKDAGKADAKPKAKKSRGKKAAATVAEGGENAEGGA
jgi:small subunit ribosomal protein S2